MAIAVSTDAANTAKLIDVLVGTWTTVLVAKSKCLGGQPKSRSCSLGLLGDLVVDDLHRPEVARRSDQKIHLQPQLHVGNDLLGGGCGVTAALTQCFAGSGDGSQEPVDLRLQTLHGVNAKAAS